MFLEDIIAKRKIQLEREMSEIPPNDMIKRSETVSRSGGSFKKALEKKGLSVIAEVKKASPSKGLIQPDFNPVKLALAYERAGADAVSCLTEESYFQGSARYLEDIRKSVNIPLLRKDFIIDPYQIYQAKAIGADAVLLIAAVLDDEKLRELYDLAGSLSLDVLAEAHTEEEVNRLLALDFDIIGINNRNLKTFEVSLDNTKELIKLIPENKGIVTVCESGIKDNADMRFARDCGADGVLIGETLMRSGAEGIPSCMTALREGLL
ncbi:MAG: indole-3-glycerol phosphate synthase TrpC [Ruminococcus sp.]|nr:indole-3-glycerol phosphate synthase TrpC [Ruminococcus sp.]